MENAGKKYLCKKIKSREDFDEFKPYLEGWCVIDDADGAISVVASRWNSDGEQERFLSDAELKQVIGQNNFGRLK